MGLSIPQYFNEYTAVNGYGPVHTRARWVWFSFTTFISTSKPFDNQSFSHKKKKGITVSLNFLFQFNDMINVPFASEPFVAGFLALFLDVTLHSKDNAMKKDRGMHWWDKFRSFKTDTRSEEFYSLPFNLNKFFPSVWLHFRLNGFVVTTSSWRLCDSVIVCLVVPDVLFFFLFLRKSILYMKSPFVRLANTF